MASQVDAVEREFLLCARYGELEEMLEELAKGADVMARGDGGNGPPGIAPRDADSSSDDELVTI